MVQFFQFVVLGLMMGGIYSLLGMAIALVCKGTSIVSLAHGQIVFFGAYFLWLFYTGFGWPLYLAFPIALILAGLMGLFIERFTMRPLIGQPVVTAFLVTLAVFLALDGAGQFVLKGGTRVFQPPFIPIEPVRVGGLIISQAAIWGFGVALMVGLLLAIFLRYTRMGLAMRITAEDHLVAQSMGIRVKSVFSWLWIISAIVAGIAGIFMATTLDIYYTLPQIAFKGLIVALFGGLESVKGALIGGLILGVLEGLAGGYIEPLVGGGFRETAAYAFMLLILLVRPYGLFGLVRIERV